MDFSGQARAPLLGGALHEEAALPQLSKVSDTAIPLDDRVAYFVRHKDRLAMDPIEIWSPAAQRTILRPNPMRYPQLLRAGWALLSEKVEGLSDLTSHADKVDGLKKVHDLVRVLQEIVEIRLGEAGTLVPAELEQQKKILTSLQQVLEKAPSSLEDKVARCLEFCDKLKWMCGVMISYISFEGATIGLLLGGYIAPAPTLMITCAFIRCFGALGAALIPGGIRRCGERSGQGYEAGSPLCSIHGACLNSAGLLEQNGRNKTALNFAVTQLTAGAYPLAPALHAPME